MTPSEFQVPEDEFRTEFFVQNDFTRLRCESCGSHFWTQDPDLRFCGDSPCVEYLFIGDPPTTRRYSLSEMRDAFLDFFRGEGHDLVEPYPVVARWRDDLLVTIAGIVDFQPYVTDGIADPPANPLVVSQPCLRFEDLENVGFTQGRHLTIFEMGGHFAFNFPDKPEIYWKDRTIELHHRFVTHELGVPSDQVVYKEHFWSGGGNAGPDVEGSILGLEASTLVFMQYKVRNGSLIPSPVRTVDTGYGIDRFSWLSQGTPSAFEVIYEGLAETVLKWADVEADEEVLLENARLSGFYLKAQPEESGAARRRAAERVGLPLDEFERIVRPYEDLYGVLDNSKALVFLLSEGAVPSNVQEGYLSRLLFRRLYRVMMTHGIQDRLEDLIEGQIDLWGRPFETVREMRDGILDMIRVEKGKYLETLRRGKALVRRLIKKEGTASLGLDTLIELYDSHGLHPEIVAEIAEGDGVRAEVPVDFFSRVAQRHQERRPPEEAAEKTRLEKEPEVKKLFYEDPYLAEFEAKVSHVEGNHVVLDRTAFYPEGGGQLGDSGILEFDGKHVRVKDTQTVGRSIVHLVEGSPPRVGQLVRGRIDWDRRYSLMRNHDAVHIILGSARNVLGKHVWQAGSEVTPEHARLDVTHYERITPEELSRIETLANEQIAHGRSINSYFLERSEAERRYGTSIYQGGAVPGKTLRIIEVEGWDVEACGGTHTSSARELMMIKILSGDRVQEGVERLVFTAGMEAVRAVQEMDRKLSAITESIGSSRERVVQDTTKLREEHSWTRDKLKKLKNRYIELLSEKLAGKAQARGVAKVVIWSTDEEDMQDLIDLGERLVKRDNGVLYVGNTPEKGTNCVIFCGPELVKIGFSALEIAQLIANKAGGGSSGDETFARAGGKSRVDIQEVVEQYATAKS